MLDEEACKNLAKELKIDLFTVWREYLQLLFLKYFYAGKNTEKVYFKGGTALRFLFGSFRFSEDLDFSSNLSSLVIEKLIEKTLENLNKEGINVGFKERKTLGDSYSGRIFQRLKGFNFPLTIRMDFSLREKPVEVENSYVETIFPVTAYPLVTHLSSAEMLSEKIRALLIRRKGRDVFDIWFLLTKKVPINWKLVNKKMLIYNKNASPEELISVIKNISDDEIKADLARFLPLSHREIVARIKNLTLKKIEEQNYL